MIIQTYFFSHIEVDIKNGRYDSSDDLKINDIMSKTKTQYKKNLMFSIKKKYFRIALN